MTKQLLPADTLERLSRHDGVDTRPILIRVLTDLFVQKSDHTAEEVAHYQELAGQLIDVVDIDARAAVARKLADDPRAPQILIDRLIADDPAVSAPIIARFAGVPRATLLALALDGGPVEAAAVAARKDIDEDMIRVLAHHRDELVLETLAANPAAELRGAALQALVDGAVDAPALAQTLLRRENLDAAALAPLYSLADPARRAAIREALAARPARLSGTARSSRNAEALSQTLVEAATQTGQGSAIALALAEALDLKPGEAARLATEASGEPFVMMLRAAGLSDELVIRALLIAQPEIAHSVHRFFDLVEIAETTSRSVAAEIVRALTRRPEEAQAKHEPLFEPLGTMERAGQTRPAQTGRRVADRQDQARRRN